MNALLAMLRKKAQATWIGYALAFAFAAAIPVTNYFTLQAAMKQMRFVAMDSRSTFYLTAAGSFEESKTIHAELARMAAETIFDRNPDGFDNPERLERLFNPVTAGTLNKDATKDSDTFKSQQIHQKLETGPIKEVNVSASSALVSVEGQVLRSWIFNGRIMNESKAVTIFLKMDLNDAMSQNGRYPLVVTNYETKF